MTLCGSMVIWMAGNLRDYFFFLPRCSHTWERAPISEHRADSGLYCHDLGGVRDLWTGFGLDDRIY
jgi:hypothetical protein